MAQTSVSTKYQVVIPKEIRKKVKIQPGQKFEVNLTGEQIVLTPKKSEKKLNWPEDYYKKLKGLWKPDEVDEYLERERNSWD